MHNCIIFGIIYIFDKKNQIALLTGVKMSASFNFRIKLWIQKHNNAKRTNKQIRFLKEAFIQNCVGIAVSNGLYFILVSSSFLGEYIQFSKFYKCLIIEFFT